MKNLLIFFDNHGFRLNNIVINHIKRWVVYKIIYNSNQYDNICIYKTYPEFSHKIICLNKNNISENDIDEIMIFINNIIYKKIDKYATICFKYIIDKINLIQHIFSENTNEIFIFTLFEYNMFSIENINYINDIINNIKSEINLINILGNKIFMDIFPKINEFVIDINCLKIENINIHEIFAFNNINDFDIIKYYKNNNHNKYLYKYDYLKLIYNIESFLLNNLLFDNLTLNNEQFEIINILMNNTSIYGIESFNTQLLNIFKSYKNSVQDILTRHNNILIKLPISKLNIELSCSYIKYILEFYSIIYPKINYYKLINSSDKKHKNKPKNISENTSEIKIKNIKNINLEKDDLSCQYLTSSLTMTNWKDEYDNANPFGFLIEYNPNKLSYKGILDLNSSILTTYPNMIIINITTNFVSLYDYYQIILFDYENDNENNNENDNENNNENDNNNISSKKKTFNISRFKINDNISGDGNVLLPLYINKYHWELTKSLWTYHISFINNCFEQEYNKKMDNIYFFVILKFLDKLKNNINNIKIIRLFCYILRTCIQILIDNKFMNGIKNEYKKHLELVLSTDLLNNNCIFSDWIVRVIQLIISNGIENEELEADLNKITTSIFKKYIISNYKIDFWDMIHNTTDICKNNELEILKNQVIQDNICWLYLDFDIKILNKIIKSIYSLNGFNQFIKQIDKTNGCLEETQEKTKLINLGIIKDIIELKYSEQFDIDYYYKFIDISKYYN
jgi:hypothetical protein